MNLTERTAHLPGVVHVVAADVHASKLRVKMTVIWPVMGFLSDKYRTATKQVLRHARQLHTHTHSNTHRNYRYRELGWELVAGVVHLDVNLWKGTDSFCSVYF